MADGSITFSTELDNEPLEKQLKDTKKNIEKLEQSISKKEAKKSPLVEQAQKLEADIKAARVEAEKFRDAWTGGAVGADASQSDVLAKISAMESEYARVVGQIDKIDSGLLTAYHTLDGLKEKAGGFAQQIAGSAVGAGENAAGRVKSILTGLASISQRALGVIGRAGGAVATAFKGLAGAAVSAFKRLNAFPRLTDSLSGKFSRLGRTIKSALVFSVVYRGLAGLRNQIGAYLGANDQLMSAFRKMNGSLAVAFQPIFDAVIPALISLINFVTRAANAVASLIATIFGTTAKKAKQSAQAMASQTAAIKGAGKAAKETGKAAEDAAKSMAGFDEINQLTNNDASGGGGGAGGGGDIPALDFSDIDNESVFNTWGEAFNAFLDDMLINGLPRLESALDGFADRMNGFSANLLEMFTFPGVVEKVQMLGEGIANAFNGLVRKIDWAQLGAALGAGINTMLTFLVSFIYSFDWLYLGGSIATLINNAIAMIDWYNFGKLLFARFKIAIEFLAGLLLGLDMVKLAAAASRMAIGFFDSLTETIQKINWKKIGEQVRDFLVNIDWKGVAISVATSLGAAVGALMEVLRGLLGDAWKALVDWWHDAAYEDGKFTIKGLLDGIVYALADILGWLKEYVFDPFMKGFKSVFGINSPSRVMKEQGGFIMDGLLDGIKAQIDTVIGAFTDIRDRAQGVLDGIITFVKGVFSHDWEEAWDGVSKIFKNVWNGIVGLMEGAANLIINAVNLLIQGLNKIKFEVPDWVPGIGGKSFGINISAIPNLKIPRLAQGAVIPPNREFMAVLGDQRSGNNLEAPEELIRQIVREEGGGGEMTIKFAGNMAQLVRVMKPYIDKEDRRRGVRLVNGV